MLEIGEGHVGAAVDALWASGLLVTEKTSEGEAIFLQKLYQAEVQVAERLNELREAPTRPLKGLGKLVADFERDTGIELAPAQRAAVEAAAEKKVLVITGGPGVGKTTLVQAILAVFAGEKLRIHLAAPTGRAAKRLTESTGRRAQTIHRLLEVEGRGNKFARHAENPLETDLLIVDEASMVDIHLAASLLAAVPNAARLVIVGDADQLPSVGAGAFLNDLIASGALPVARLDVIFRQAGESGIIENSHKILRGEQPIGSDDPAGDFFVIQCKSPDRAVEMVRQVVTERIPQRFGLDPKKDVQVLTPMHRGGAGTIVLNGLLQKELNPRGDSIGREEGQIRVGDKVLQMKNDYNKEVFNGDLGEVAEVDSEVPSLKVSFDGDEGTRLVEYEKGEISQLSLAYATSIHKSQGSEYPAVVIPFLTQHYVMLSRNLLYTAVTRAKKLCVLVADKRALSMALAETRRELRQTRLAERLRSVDDSPLG
jgi:exodeoxyribonuclease V alpha subunit